jgi:hypothetical protein
VVVEAIPYRPLPPIGAPYEMSMPLRLSDGEWHTVNTGLDDKETLWHFRSGWNVAALNCSGPEYEPITAGYGAFLQRFSRELAAANRDIERQFRDEAETARDAIRAREAHMTQVYNYFAMPGARSQFCTTALAVANDALLTPPEDPTIFAATGLARYEAAFRQFFGDYARYETLSADWDRRYGAQYGASQPGWVAVHGASGPGVAASLLRGEPQPIGEVFDPATGAMIPVISAPADGGAQPVVQPLPIDEAVTSPVAQPVPSDGEAAPAVAQPAPAEDAAAPPAGS